MQLAGITNPRELSHFLGQCAVETGGFRAFTESLNYSVEALIRSFGRHRISVADAQKFGRTRGRPAHQNALANILYGGVWGARNLGNTHPGDGWDFRGRGLIQTTGRRNYTDLSHGMFGDERLLESPELLGQLPLLIDSAIFYWKARRIGPHAQRNDAITVTKLVNGGKNHIDYRIERTKFAMRLLGAS